MQDRFAVHASRRRPQARIDTCPTVVRRDLETRCQVGQGFDADGRAEAVVCGVVRLTVRHWADDERALPVHDVAEVRYL